MRRDLRATSHELRTTDRKNARTSRAFFICSPSASPPRPAPASQPHPNRHDRTGRLPRVVDFQVPLAHIAAIKPVLPSRLANDVILERSSFRQNGQVSWRKAPSAAAPPAYQHPIRGRRDHRQVRLARARTVPASPIGKVAPGHDRFGGAGQKRPHRLRNYRVQSTFGVETGGARPHGVVQPRVTTSNLSASRDSTSARR